MYAGKVVELGDVHTIFESPRHPYTVGLMDSLPKLNADDDWLRPIPGQPPSLISPTPGLPIPPALLPFAGTSAAAVRRSRRSTDRRLGAPDRVSFRRGARGPHRAAGRVRERGVVS